MKRVLVFEAHGDDMEFFAGGTIAKFAAAGHEVTVVCATDNDKGSFELSGEELRGIRDRELHDAAAVLGVKHVIALGYPDGDLAYRSTTEELRGRFMRVIREVKPHIMFTWDPWAPFEGHPDHRAVAWAASEAASFSHMPLFHPEQIDDEGLQPHYVGEQWYFAKSPREQNKFVDIDATIQTKIDALYKHDGQMVLTVAEMKHELAASGLNVPWLAALDPHDYREVIDKRMRLAAQTVAKRAGLTCTYAEGFRRERFGGIESLAKDQTIAEDV